ncbi:MAG: PQQ-binding-like beta-propeller repeat protein [Holosporaceae bacterium]|jgi:outer membrane protein assembly factor BamB|nr:PQQ-binding-like beta-propeller repeat protein [Holosporaceae bacterium]
MTKKTYVSLGCVGLLICGCSSKEHLKGKREELIVSELSGQSLEETDSSPVVVDEKEDNSGECVQPHYTASHYYMPRKFSLDPSKIWSSSLDFEASSEIKMTAAPVVAEGKVFCLDAAGIVYAFDQKSGARLWRKSTTLIGKDGQIGGALVYDKGRLVVTSSFAEGVCFDAGSGSILWRIKLPAASKGDGITIDNGKAFILCSNSSLHCVDIANGKILWAHSGMISNTAFIGCSCVAIEDGVIYCAYPSGEIFALLEETGAVIWDAMLSKFSLINAASAFSHPRACPVVKDGVVYFVAANAQTSAYDTRSGKLLWKNDFGGVQTPIVSGNSIFVFNARSEVACLNRLTGKPRWVKSYTRNEKEIADWCSMVLLKDYLLMISPSGLLTFLSLRNGSIKKVVRISESGEGVSVNSTIAGGRLYLLMNSGKIVVYR